MNTSVPEVPGLQHPTRQYLAYIVKKKVFKQEWWSDSIQDYAENYYKHCVINELTFDPQAFKDNIINMAIDKNRWKPEDHFDRTKQCEEYEARYQEIDLVCLAQRLQWRMSKADFEGDPLGKSYDIEVFNKWSLVCANCARWERSYAIIYNNSRKKIECATCGNDNRIFRFWRPMTEAYITKYGNGVEDHARRIAHYSIGVVWAEDSDQKLEIKRDMGVELVYEAGVERFNFVAAPF